MDDLARRAMLGDEQAQKECAEKGIMLPCPFCGGPAMVEYDTMEPFEYTVLCGDCGVINGTSEDEKVAIAEWNARPAPPIGRCKDCAYKGKAKVNEKGFLVCPASGMEITDEDFCSYFEPKESVVK